MDGQLLTELLFKRIIALIIEEHRTPLDETECGDETSTRFSNRSPSNTEAAIDRSHVNCQFNRSHLVHVESPKVFLNGVTVGLTQNTFQHLARIQIRQTKSFNRQIRFKPCTVDDSKVADLIPCSRFDSRFTPN